MTQQKLSEKNKKLVIFIGLPVLILLFVGIFYAALRSGRVAPDPNKQGTALNTQLPTANLPAQDKNKMELYLDAQKDSLHKLEQQRNDPYIKRFLLPQENVASDSGASLTEPPRTHRPDENEQRIQERLRQMEAIMNQSSQSISYTGTSAGSAADYTGNAETIQQLEKLLTEAGTKPGTDDEELDQINTMLDKLLDVQHPERVKSRKTKHSETSRTYQKVYTSAVTTGDTLLHYSLPGEEGVSNAFYTLNRPRDTAAVPDAAIRAVVHQTQTLQDGATIKLRLLQPVYINGTTIPKDQFLFGKCSINDERLVIALDKIIYNNEIFPVNLAAYDGVDGQLGLNVPGAITRDAAKENADNAIQSIGLGTLDPSVSAQAASLGLQTAKSMLSRKVKTIKVTAKAGDILLLKNEELLR